MTKLTAVLEKLGYTQLTSKEISHTFSGAYTSDLLSDVMGNAEEGSLLITIQAHKNSVAVASLIGMPAIILCNGRTPNDDMIEAADQENIAILSTTDSQFVSSYKIAQLLGLM
ncbi:MAG: iron-sulfur binding hydrogenase [Sphaerochaetaceae bacterium]|jgi:serine kinase of HPr protein (carbohydrate metabolism regulator)